MERRITEIEKIREFSGGVTGEVHGVYKCKFKGASQVFVRHGDRLYVLQHFLDSPSLNIIHDDIRDEFLEVLKESV